MGYPGARSYFLEFLIEGKLSLYKLHEWLLHWKEIIFFFQFLNHLKDNICVSVFFLYILKTKSYDYYSIIIEYILL